jgi:TonB family protein
MATPMQSVVGGIARFGLLLFVLTFAGSAAAAAPDALPPGQPSCDEPHGIEFDRKFKQVGGPEPRYPDKEVRQWGEGWVRFQISITEAGTVKDLRLHDAIGAPIYGEMAAADLRQFKFDPAVLQGKPVTVHTPFDFSYQIPNVKFGGAHVPHVSAFAQARNLRAERKYAEALDVLNSVRNERFNMHEAALWSYSYALTYMGLNDWRRALRHVEHAVLYRGEYLDRFVRPEALALDIELLARDHKHYSALCTYADLKKQYPKFKPSAALTQVLDGSYAELAASTPVRTEVELTESGRADVPTFWRHRLLRRSFSIEAVQGPVSRFLLVCPTVQIGEPVQAGQKFETPPEWGICRLSVFGDAGARFTLEER